MIEVISLRLFLKAARIFESVAVSTALVLSSRIIIFGFPYILISYAALVAIYSGRMILVEPDRSGAAGDIKNFFVQCPSSSIRHRL